MLKLRIIPTLLFKNFTLVKGVRFNSWRRIGSVMQTVKVFNMREVDELAFLDISATIEGRTPDFELVDEIADECFMPLAVGGGIKSLEDVRKLLSVGADKVILGSVAVSNPQLISDIANNFGSQSVVVSVDVSKINGDYEVFINSGIKPTGIKPENLIKKMEEMGAGEILLTSIDRDGTMSGYDVDLIKKMSNITNIPLIASGGAGSYKDMLEITKEANVSALAAASIFYFTEQTPLEAKKYLKENGVNVRL
ncbi:MAG: imidazole glycerol phosphate synthase cyclase subunit [Candidatus Magasanikbacteria bacterium]